jgi:hypothetical protein
MGESRSVWTPHHQRMIRWEQIQHRWMGECVAKPPPTRGLNSPPLMHRVGKLCGITWNKNTILLFSTRGFTTARFGWWLSKDLAGGAPTNHELPNQNFANKHQLFYWDVDLEDTFLYPWIFWMFINVETLFLTYGYLKCLKCKNMPLIPCLPIYIWLILWSYNILGW